MEQSDKDMLFEPLASIKRDGILGLKLGDAEEKVLSRIKTLGLLNDEEIKRGKLSIAAGLKTVESGYLIIGQNMFREISSIQLNINCFGLKTITVNIKRKQNITIQQQLEQLTVLVNYITGQMPTHGLRLWNLDNNNISVYYIDNNVICLEFDKHLY